MIFDLTDHQRTLIADALRTAAYTYEQVAGVNGDKALIDQFHQEAVEAQALEVAIRP